MAMHGTRYLAAAHYLSAHISLFDVSSGPPAGLQPLCVVSLPDMRAKPPPPSAPLKVRVRVRVRARVRVRLKGPTP